MSLNFRFVTIARLSQVTTCVTLLGNDADHLMADLNAATSLDKCADLFTSEELNPFVTLGCTH